jgi:mannose-6-phosphate isomerase-like protein (cupin superfamily)
MPIIRAADAPQFDLPGAQFTVLAAPSLGSEGLCTWRLRLAAGPRDDAPHTLDRDEVFMVLSGTVQLTPGGEKLEAGDAAVVPAGQPIQVRNLGGSDAEIHVAITAGFTATMADGTKVQPPWAK